MSRGSSLADFFGEIIADIRQKVVEEGWFGRRVTPPLQSAPDEERESDLGWVAWKDAEPNAQDPAGPDHGHDIER